MSLGGSETLPQRSVAMPGIWNTSSMRSVATPGMWKWHSKQCWPQASLREDASGFRSPSFAGEVHIVFECWVRCRHLGHQVSVGERAWNTRLQGGDGHRGREEMLIEDWALTWGRNCFICHPYEKGGG